MKVMDLWNLAFTDDPDGIIHILLKTAQFLKTQIIHAFPHPLPVNVFINVFKVIKKKKGRN